MLEKLDIRIAKEVMAGDVLPVAMFQLSAVLLPFWPTAGLYSLLKTLTTEASFVGCLSR